MSPPTLHTLCVLLFLFNCCYWFYFSNNCIYCYVYSNVYSITITAITIYQVAASTSPTQSLIGLHILIFLSCFQQFEVQTDLWSETEKLSSCDQDGF